MMTESKAQTQRRLDKFDWNLKHAKWGMFPVSDSGNPVICGVCGMEYDTQMAKADHLWVEHGADVWVFTASKEPMYEWRRA